MASTPRLAFDTADKLEDYKVIRPLWSIDYSNKEALCQWVSAAVDLLVDDRRDAIIRGRENIQRYLGNCPSVEPVIGGRDLPMQKRTRSKLVVPHFKDLVEQKVTKHTKSKPNTSVVPPNPEIADKLDAHVAEEVLFSIKYENDLDELYARALRMAVLTGTAFIHAYWDEHKGDLHPDWKKIRESKEKVKLVDADGEPVKDVNGKEIEISRPVYQGDVAFRLRYIWDTFLDPQAREEDTQWVILLDYVPTVELEHDYPSCKGKIKPDEKATFLNPHTLVEKKLENHCAVFTVYHRANRFIEDGLYFKCTRECMLFTPRPNPVSYIPGSALGNLPIRVLKDIKVEGEVYGEPSASDIAPLQSVFDKVLTLCVKNIFWASHFRVFATQGSVDRAEITNDSTVVWVKPGYTPPTAISFQAFNSDVFNFLQYLETGMEKVFGIFSISRGAPPPGTRAAASLYFYDEQESQRGAGLQKQFNKLIVDVDKLILAIVGDNYKDHDNRLMKILGTTKRWIVKRFKVDSLRKSHDIRLENSPALPDSRYAKFELLTNLKERIPGAISDEQFADILDFGNHDKFITPTRQARLAAEAENEDFMRGVEVADPEMWDDQIVHWQTHLKEMQNPDFRNWPQDHQDALILHVQTHERMMDEMAQQSGAYAQQLTLIPQFPVVYERAPMLPPPPMPMPGEQMPVEPPPPASEPVAPQLMEGGLPPELLPQQPIS